MPQLHCYINQKMADQLESIRQGEGYDSTSQAMKEMIALGIKVYLINKESDDKTEAEKNRLEKEEELQKMHTTYLLRIMELSADILRCVYDKDKAQNGQQVVGDQIALIKKKVDDYIHNYVSN